MENLDSALLQYVKAEIAKAGQRKKLPAANLDVMPPAEKRERVATLEREAALIKQLTFNLKMAEEMQSLRDLILGISVDVDKEDGAYDEDEFDATQIIAEDIQAELDNHTIPAPDLRPAAENLIAAKAAHGIEDEDYPQSLLERLINTKLKKAVVIGVSVVAVLLIIGQLPASFKSWIFPLLNYLGT